MATIAAVRAGATPVQRDSLSWGLPTGQGEQTEQGSAASGGAGSGGGSPVGGASEASPAALREGGASPSSMVATTYARAYSATLATEQRMRDLELD